MTFRDDLIDCVDDIRGITDTLDLRRYTVVVRSVTWSGTEMGEGAATNSDLTLTPTPKVSAPSPRMMTAAPGMYETGDRIVDKISAAYTLSELGYKPNEETQWLIDGELYRLVGVPEEKNFEWCVLLRRMNR